MFSISSKFGLVGLVGLVSLSIGCVDGEVGADDGQFAAATQAVVSPNAQNALDWANGWIKDVKDDATRLDQNVYTTSTPGLERAVGTTKAKNRSVCGTLITQLLQKSIALVPNDFYKSFNKAMNSCEVGTVTVGGVDVQKGTNSPNAAQYQYKIANCPNTGPITFTARTTITGIELGDLVAVKYTESTSSSNSGHVMMVRGLPTTDANLPAGPTGSTAYAVSIIDSTETPHGSASGYADWRGGTLNQGLGHGTFVLYADATGAIVASRWSPSDPTVYDTTAHPIAIGGLQ